MSTSKAEIGGTVEAGTGHVHVDSPEALQEELRREAAEGSATIGDMPVNHNVSGSSTWVTQSVREGDESGENSESA